MPLFFTGSEYILLQKYKLHYIFGSKLSVWTVRSFDVYPTAIHQRWIYSACPEGHTVRYRNTCSVCVTGGSKGLLQPLLRCANFCWVDRLCWLVKRLRENLLTSALGVYSVLPCWYIHQYRPADIGMDYSYVWLVRVTLRLILGTLREMWVKMQYQ